MLLALLPLVGHAAYNDVSLTTDAIVTVGSIPLNVSGTADVVESITVDSTNLSVTMPAGSTLTIQSANRYSLPTNSSSLYVTDACTPSYSAVTLTVPSGGATQSINVTPNSSINCSYTTSASGSSGRSSGGGGSSSAAPAKTVVPVALVVTPAKTAAASPSLLKADLARGSQNSEVSMLQALLAQDKALYPEGSVTGLFGPATERAVKRFQAKYGISQVGRVGPATREKLNQVYLNAVPAVAPAAAPAPASAPAAAQTVSAGGAFTKVLSKGASGDDVRRLQVILNSDNDTRIASQGIGSPGNETTTYGSLTSEAVGKFQVKYGIASPGDPGYGTVGPKTRLKLNEFVK